MLKILGSVLAVDESISKTPTNEQLESALFVRDSILPDEENEVETFSDIKEFFDGWNQYEQFCEMYFNGIDSDECRKAFADDHWDTVYDYITDCLHWYGGAFLPVRIVDRTISNVHCEADCCGLHFTADFDGITLFGTVGENVECFDVPYPEVIELEGEDVTRHLTTPSVPVPTWGEILDAIRSGDMDNPLRDENIGFAETLLADEDLNSRPVSYFS